MSSCTKACRALGVKNLKPLQQEVIDHLLKGRHALVLMPTGWGKSLCYQVPALMCSGLTVVVSPLIALMRDQSQRLKQKQIPAESLHSALTKKEKQKILKDLSLKRLCLLYVTPERLAQPSFLSLLKEQKLNFMAIDEAHCISQWGHDFRLEYSRLGAVRSDLNHPVTVALTATAPPSTRADILKSLCLPSGTSVFKASVERKELSLNVLHTVGGENKLLELQKIIKKHKKGIVYFSLIRTLQKVAEKLNSLKVLDTVCVYHSELAPSVRHKNSEDFLNGKASVMLATPAFGLGVDKKDIRFVVHFETPLSVEAYYQEAGRAGRDQKPAACHLLYDADDLSIGMDFIKWANPSLSFIRSVYDLLKNQKDKVRSGGLSFLREQMNFYNRRDFRVDTALNLLSHLGFLVRHPRRLGMEVASSPSAVWPAPHLIEQKKHHQTRLFYEMLKYVKSRECRSLYICRYFGEENTAPCGQCDNCLNKNPS